MFKGAQSLGLVGNRILRQKHAHNYYYFNFLFSQSSFQELLWMRQGLLMRNNAYSWSRFYRLNALAVTQPTASLNAPTGAHNTHTLTTHWTSLHLLCRLSNVIHYTVYGIMDQQHIYTIKLPSATLGGRGQGRDIATAMDHTNGPL